jgi:hypothetical protein
MILVYQDPETKAWHLLRKMLKSGLSIKIESYCKETINAEAIQQLPSNYLAGCCADCKAAYKDLMDGPAKKKEEKAS